MYVSEATWLNFRRKKAREERANSNPGKMAAHGGIIKFERATQGERKRKRERTDWRALVHVVASVIVFYTRCAARAARDFNVGINISRKYKAHKA